MQENVFRANEYDELVEYLRNMGIYKVHMTNGSFSRDNEEKPWQVASTMLAGFEYMRNEFVPEDGEGHAFLVAVNAPESDVESYGHDPETTPDEQERLNRFLPYLETQFANDVPVVAVFFDKASAMDIHRALFDSRRIDVAHEFKYGWGFGERGPIVTHDKTQAIAFPYFDQTLPVNAQRGPWDPKNAMSEEERLEKFGPGSVERHESKNLNAPASQITRVINLYRGPTNLAEGASCIKYLNEDDTPDFELRNGLRFDEALRKIVVPESPDTHPRLGF